MRVALFEILYRLNRFVQSRQVSLIKRRRTEYTSLQVAAFDHLWQETLASGVNARIEYDLPYPKIDFLHYLCDHLGYAVHGTNNLELQVLEPIRLSTDASDFGNRRQIFCSLDAAWGMWFAILDKKQFRTTRNGCVRLDLRNGEWVKLYHFELERRLQRTPPYSDGMIYIVGREDFPSRHTIPVLETFGAEFEEWGSLEPVTPLAHILVGPDDFPYLKRVAFCIKPH